MTASLQHPARPAASLDPSPASCPAHRYPTVWRSALGMTLGLTMALSLACSERGTDGHERHADEHVGEGHADQGDHAEHGEAGHRHGEDEAPESLRLDDVRGVRYVTVGQPVAEGAWFAAEAVADETAVSLLTAPVAGVVEAIRVPVGKEVTAGMTLLSLRSGELAQLDAAWQTARARRAQSTTELAREQRLVAAGAGARRELEAAQANDAVAAAEETAARLALESRGVRPGAVGGGSSGLSQFAVPAPRSGVVARWEVLVGQTVETGAVLGTFETARAAIARVELSLPGPQDWVVGTATTVRRSDGSEWQAVVEGVPTSLSTSSRRLVYRLRLASGEDAAPLPLAGTPLEARVPLASAIVVPQVAVQQVEGTWGVFVVLGGEATFRPVRRGAELGGDVMVLEGLSPGETIATDGAYLLKTLSLKLAGGGGGHEH